MTHPEYREVFYRGRGGSRRTRFLAHALLDSIASREHTDVSVFDPFLLSLTDVESRRLTRILPAAKQVARETGVPVELLLGVSRVESTWRPEVVNEIGCVGLMQICPVTAEDFGLSQAELKDPVTNFRAGVRDLRRKGLGRRRLLSVFKGYGGFDSEVSDPGGVDDPIRYRDEVLAWASKLSLMDL